MKGAPRAELEAAFPVLRLIHFLPSFIFSWEYNLPWAATY